MIDQDYAELLGRSPPSGEVLEWTFPARALADAFVLLLVGTPALCFTLYMTGFSREESFHSGGAELRVSHCRTMLQVERCLLLASSRRFGQQDRERFSSTISLPSEAVLHATARRPGGCGRCHTAVGCTHAPTFWVKACLQWAADAVVGTGMVRLLQSTKRGSSALTCDITQESFMLQNPACRYVPA